MRTRLPLVFKIATEDWEFDLIHQLNYKTFVEEIPQHEPSPTRRLADRFHAQNTYMICLSGRHLAGMMAVRAQRPFSLDQKLANLDSFLPPGRSLCEIRLLSVDRQFRTGQVFQGLMALMWQHGVERGYDMALISGTTRQGKLYHHLGFIPFGPQVGHEGAWYQPMYLSIESFEAGAREFLGSRPPERFERPTANFLPGPVAISRNVRRVFERPPESHRADSFVADFQDLQRTLCEMTGAGRVEILLGSGTLANDAVAGQLSLEAGHGLILANGEFGERLADQARRFGLRFDVLSFPWGSALDMSILEAELNHSTPRWLWLTHCETSTGVLNDLPAIKQLCAVRGVKLCIDCISSIGTMPLDLRGVHLASASSGKGLRSFPGLGAVFYHHDIAPVSVGLPRYLDLGFYAAHQGVAFTHSSNLANALHAAVKRVDWARRFGELEETGALLRNDLREAGFQIVEPGRGTSSPAVVTIVLPVELDSVRVGARMEEMGYLLSYNSGYLRARNWIQICLFGEHNREKITALLGQLKRVCFARKDGAPDGKPAVTNALAG